VAVLTLAVAIGGVTASYSGLLAVVLDFPQIDGADHVARLWTIDIKGGSRVGKVSVRDFLEWERQTKAFGDLAGFESQTQARLKGTDDSLQVAIQPVTEAFFRVLAARPVLGTAFSRDAAASRERIAVLSHRVWQRAFGGDRAVVGRVVTLNGEPHTVVGVMPAGFWFPTPGDTVFVPLPLLERDGPSAERTLVAIGRLRPGLGWESARAEMATIAARLRRTYPETDADLGIRVVSLRQAARERLGVGLLGLLGPAVLVLLVAAVNVSNLLLARAAAREKEIAVRAALGASRPRLVRQLLAESAWLALAGGLGGLLLAVVGIRLIRAHAPAALADRMVLSPHVVGFGMLVTLATPVLFGLLPALHATRPDLGNALKESLGRPVLARGRYNLSDLLVLSEVALAVVLVVASVFWLRFFWQLEHVELGFEPQRLLVADVSLPSSRYAQDEPRVALARELRERIRALPGVEAAGFADGLPGIGEGARVVTIEGREGAAAPGIRIELFRVSGRKPVLSPVVASPGFLSTLGIPLVRGRDLSEQDAAGSLPVALVSETVARAYWPGVDALGRRFRFGEAGTKEPWISVVGVVGDVMTIPGLHVPSVHVFRPYAQAPARHLTLVVRTASVAGGAARSVRTAIEGTDRDQSLDSLQTVEERLAARFRDSHFMVGFIGVFALLALFLSAVGVFAVASHSVVRRTREIGLRMALGARPRDLVRSAVERGLALVGAGVALGLGGMLVATRLTWNAALEVALADPLLWGGVLLPLTGAAVAAFYWPARRATRIDPAEALRHE
jgi:putative ABC transport system permease protein